MEKEVKLYGKKDQGKLGRSCSNKKTISLLELASWITNACKNWRYARGQVYKVLRTAVDVMENDSFNLIDIYEKENN